MIARAIRSMALARTRVPRSGMLGSVRQRVGFSAGHWLPTIYRSPLGRRSIALSFDDGPSQSTTDRVVDLLREFGASATFFLCGRRAEQYPHLVQRLVEAGCGVYAHGYSHTRLDGLAPVAAIAELEKTEAVLARFRPTPSPYIVRLPYGAGHRSVRIHRLLSRWRSDCQLAHWGYSPKDFTLAEGCSHLSDLEQRCATAVDRAFSSRSLYGAVVLLHEDPFDCHSPLSSEVAVILLKRLLHEAKSRDIEITQLQPVRQRLLSRYLRLLHME